MVNTTNLESAVAALDPDDVARAGGTYVDATTYRLNSKPILGFDIELTESA